MYTFLRDASIFCSSEKSPENCRLVPFLKLSFPLNSSLCSATIGIRLRRSICDCLGHWCHQTLRFSLRSWPGKRFTSREFSSTPQEARSPSVLRGAARPPRAVLLVLLLRHQWRLSVRHHPYAYPERASQLLRLAVLLSSCVWWVLAEGLNRLRSVRNGRKGNTTGLGSILSLSMHIQKQRFEIQEDSLYSSSAGFPKISESCLIENLDFASAAIFSKKGIFLIKLTVFFFEMHHGLRSRFY